MKICIVTPSFEGGGAERIAINLANFYVSQNHQVTLIAVKESGPYRALVSEQVKLVDLKSSLRKALFMLKKAVVEEDADCVLSAIRATNILLGIGFLFDNRSLVFREANTMDGISQKSTAKRMVFKMLMRLSYAKARVVIANSEDTKRDLTNFHIVKPNKCKVIGNPVLPVDVGSLAESAITHTWFLDDEKKVILNVGRYHQQKNQKLLIQAFSKVVAKFPNARLVFLGEGELQADLLTLAKQLSIADYVDFIPFSTNPYPYYKNADVFVLSSNWEGFGNVIVEAMATKTPVISTSCAGGPKAILEDGRLGRLVPVGDISSLSAALCNHFENGPDNQIIEAAYIKSKDYSIERIATDYLQEMNR